MAVCFARLRREAEGSIYYFTPHAESPLGADLTDKRYKIFCSCEKHTKSWPKTRLTLIHCISTVSSFLLFITFGTAGSENIQINDWPQLYYTRACTHTHTDLYLVGAQALDMG